MANRILVPTYTPGPVPQDLPDGLRRYLSEEFQKIEAALASAAEGNYGITYAPPNKVYPGMVRLADGVKWNPIGAGFGLYMMNNVGSWTQLG
jgi:hypothetical protein